MNRIHALIEKDPGDLKEGAHVIVVRPGRDPGAAGTAIPPGYVGAPWPEVLVGVKKGAAHDFPGGHLRPGEDPAQAASRELREETGIDAPADRLTYVGKLGGLHFYTTRVPPGTEAKASSDEKALEWVPAREAGRLTQTGSLVAAALAVHESLAALAAAHPIVESRRGLLIAFEGPDGSGKSTQHRKLQEWLESNRQPAVATKWNSSARFAPLIRQAKEEQSLSPLLFSLLHAADLVERYETVIAPALQEGRTVLCDRYLYTSLVRDSLRGVDESALLALYRGLRVPDVVFHCVVPPEVAYARLTERQGSLNYYAAGMDLKLSEDMDESCRRYLELMDAAYRRILPPLLKGAYHRLNTGRLISEIAADVQRVVGDKLYARTLVTQLIG